MYVAVIVIAIVLGAFILAPRFVGDKEDAREFLERSTPSRG